MQKVKFFRDTETDRSTGGENERQSQRNNVGMRSNAHPYQEVLLISRRRISRGDLREKSMPATVSTLLQDTKLPTDSILYEERFSFHYCTLYSYLCICCDERMVSLGPETYTGSRKHSNIRRYVFRNMLPLLFNRYLIKVFCNKGIFIQN